MRKILALTAMAALMVPVAASAHDAYKSAGCGVGSLVIKKDGFMQIFALTTNGMFSQPISITFGLSNCGSGDGGGDAAIQQKQAFVEMNYANLTRDSAQGNGEYLAAYAELAGCSVDSADAFYGEVKDNYVEIFDAQEDSAQIVSSIDEAAMSAGCKG